MFQITIINNKTARLIDPPIELRKIGLKEFINPQFIPDIQNIFPCVTIVRLSMKPEVNRYELHHIVKKLLTEARTHTLNEKDTKFLDTLEKYAKKTSSVGTRYFKKLVLIAKRK